MKSVLEVDCTMQMYVTLLKYTLKMIKMQILCNVFFMTIKEKSGEVKTGLLFK